MVFATLIYTDTEVIQIDCGTKGEETVNKNPPRMLSE